MTRRDADRDRPAGGAAGDRGDTATLLTFGHGTSSHEQLVVLLRGAGVESVVDVRTAPGSRRNPDANRSALGRRLPEDGIDYRWEPRLGGFRRVAPDSPDTVWRNASFRGYAGYTRDPEFVAAMDELLAAAARARTAVMCSESVWWRCHRRIIADFTELARGGTVLHLMPDGKLRPHIRTDGVRLRPDGLLVYDAAPDSPAPEGSAPRGSASDTPAPDSTASDKPKRRATRKAAGRKTTDREAADREATPRKNAGKSADSAAPDRKTAPRKSSTRKAAPRKTTGRKRNDADGPT